MNTLQNADTFFYITSIVTILIGALAVLLLAYVVRIAQIIHSIMKTVRHESENIAGDIADLRERVREEGTKVSSFWRFATGFLLNRFASPLSSEDSEDETGRGSARSAAKRPRTRRTQRRVEPESEEGEF